MYNSNHQNFEKMLSPKKKKRKYNDGNQSSGNLQVYSPTTSSGMIPNKFNNRTINIIDRVIDLNRYNKNTGLYTLCRDWINATTSLNDMNKLTPNSLQKKSEEKLSQENPNAITRLPDPLTNENQEIDIDFLNENIKLNVRANEKSDIDLIKTLNVDDVIQTHALLKLHVNRWKLSRREWVNFYANQNKAYQNSYETLKSIYEDI